MFRGFVETTVGIVPVVKVHANLLARAVPAGSFAPVAIVAVYSVPPARGAAGVNVAVVPEYATAPVTEAPPGAVTVKVDVFIVVASIAVLKVAVTICVMGTPIAAFAGTVEATVGAVGLDVGFDAATPHPVARPAIRNASIKIFRTAILRIGIFLSIGKRRYLAAPSTPHSGGRNEVGRQLAKQILAFSARDVNLEEAQKLSSVQHCTRLFKLSMFTQFRQNRVPNFRSPDCLRAKKSVQNLCQS
jgi:hypothetical protein